MFKHLAAASVAIAIAAPSTAHAATSTTASAAPAACANATTMPTASTTRAASAATLCLLNQQRAAAHLRPLRAERTLRRSAARFATQMAAQHFFAHESPAGSTLFTRTRAVGYLRHTRSFDLGENIGFGTGSLATPAQVVDAWMRSAHHRANLLDRRFEQIGIGIAAAAPVGQAAGATYVTDFGRRSR